MSQRLLLGALFASLALNVFIGGAFAGAYLTKAKGPPPAEAPGARNPLMAAVRTLPPEARAAWRESGRELALAQGTRAREARRLARETLQGFGDEPFDQAGALTALEQARKVEFETRVAMDRRLVAFAATLPQDQRAAFGAALSRPPVRPGRPRD